jgi:hypothetical protein
VVADAAVGDVVRFAVIALAVITCAAMLTVLALHFRAWRAVRSEHGLLPLHVALISLSYAAFCALLALGVIDNLGRPLNWRTPGFGVALVAGLASLWVVGRLQRRRIDLARRPATLRVDIEEPP